MNVQERIFFCLCGFALFFSVSVAISNIFLALLTISLLYNFKNTRHDLKNTIQSLPAALIFPVIFFIVSIFISALLSQNVIFSLKVFIDIIVWRMIPLLAVLTCIKNKRQIILLITLTLFSIFSNNLACIYQGLANFNLPEWRFGGFIFVMQHASLLAVIVPVATLALMSARQNLWKIIWLVFLWVNVVALIFNGTRGAWLATFVTEFFVIVMYLHREKIKMLLSMCCMLTVVTGIFLFSAQLNDRLATVVSLENKSNYGRILIWKSAINMFQDYPLSGVGLGRFGEEYRENYILPEAVKRGYVTHAHNNFLNILAECGILVAILYLLIGGGYLIYFSIKGWFKFHDESFLFLFCVVTGIFLHGLTEYTFGATTTTKFYWFAMGLCLQWRKIFSR